MQEVGSVAGTRTSSICSYGDQGPGISVENGEVKAVRDGEGAGGLKAAQRYDPHAEDVAQQKQQNIAKQFSPN